jgi:uncharacterized protein
MMMNRVDNQASDARTENFGYVCHRCTKCCRHKRIQLNPYEVARLARNRGVSTGEFRARWTEDGAGVVLQRTETGHCIFLSGEGCSVHPDRPLVCRLYPLGRHVRPDGTENFSHIKPHPQTRGEYSRNGTIADFLSSQDAAPFMQAADEYFFWLCAVQNVTVDRSRDQATQPAGKVEAKAGELLDIDGAIADYCARTKLAEPHEIEARKRLHLKILYQQLETRRGGHHESAESDRAKQQES